MEPKIPPVSPKTETPAWLREGVNLKMTAKGYYYWEINTYGTLNAGLIQKVKSLDTMLRSAFPENVTMFHETHPKLPIDNVEK